MSALDVDFLRNQRAHIENGYVRGTQKGKLRDLEFQQEFNLEEQLDDCMTSERKHLKKVTLSSVYGIIKQT